MRAKRAALSVFRRYIILPIVSLFAACSDGPLYPVYSHDQCHRLNLIDAATHQSIRGAEDLTTLPGGALLVSAYDRRARLDNGAPPEGGLYIVPPSALLEQEVEVSSVLESLPYGIRPHGVDALGDADGRIHVAFVNRDYVEKNGRLVENPSLIRFDLYSDAIRNLTRLSDPLYCRANDVLLRKSPDGPLLQMTLDRRECGGLHALIENVTGAQKGRLIRLTPDNTAQIEADQLAFPNGVGIQFHDKALGDDNFLVVAETRANELRYFPKTDRRDRVKLNGSPDNLSVGQTGIIQVAVHPSLIKLALYRYGWLDFAPSRIQKVTGTQVLTLFDDPTGAYFSGASVAIQSSGKLVIGSLGDEGLLVCGSKTL